MKRFEIRLEKRLHNKLRGESFRTGKSMHEIVLGLIEKHYKKESLEMLKLIVKDHGQEEILKEGSLVEIVKHLKENDEIINWVLDEEPEMELPNLNEVKDIEDLQYELKKIDLSWWTLEVRKD